MKPVDLYALYCGWCSANGVVGDDKLNNINLGKRLRRLGFWKTRSNGKDYWCVEISDGGREITSKRTAKVSTIPSERSELNVPLLEIVPTERRIAA